MFYDTFPPTEYVYECPQYTLIDYRCLGIHGSHLYLIQDGVTGKYNIYSVDEYIDEWYRFELYIVENFNPIPLDIAWYLFPHYSLTNETYGF